jgi:hypothetical protein
MKQIHDQFKLFIGEEVDFAPLLKQAEQYADRKEVFAKSIGIAYLGNHDKVILTLGFSESILGDSETEIHYGINLDVVSLNVMLEENIHILEKMIGDASDTFKDILCHELLVNKDNTIDVIFMTKK